MRLSDIAKALRDTSERFGGIRHYLEAAGQLDRACSEFFKDQDLESLRVLNGAVANAERFRKEIAVKKQPEAV